MRRKVFGFFLGATNAVVLLVGGNAAPFDQLLLSLQLRVIFKLLLVCVTSTSGLGLWLLIPIRVLEEGVRLMLGTPMW